MFLLITTVFFCLFGCFLKKNMQFLKLESQNELWLINVKYKYFQFLLIKI